MTPSNLGFLPISLEITEHALTFCHPRDVASFSQTCRRAWLLVYNNADQYLWRRLFLLYPFDDPRKTQCGFCEHTDFDWMTELRQRIRAETIARSARSTPEELLAALHVFLGVVRSAPPVTRGCERVPSSSLLWVVDVLQSTNMLQRPPFSQWPTCQTLARLRSYLALTLDEYDDEDEEGKQRMKLLRARSRGQVYDLSNYNRDNDWGPFMPRTGEADWFHIECVVNVISCNITELEGRFVDIRPPCGLGATRAYSAPHATTRPPYDWAGVEGNWRRFISFLDYRDFFDFNFHRRGNCMPFFEDTSILEATRLIELELHLISPYTLPNYYDLDRFPDSEDPKYPTLYFSGPSWGVHANETMVVGSVYMAHDGVVHWRFASVHEAHMQWRSEGLQIGGIASATGVVGTWIGAHHEHGDPVGPFWLWKVPDDHPSYIPDLIHF
ncbi:hypothetical protein PAXRUDRAFT_822197 [Paxillus rubicundulus Ve08.2h10]|uniref:F-box domain-containing protein n=1 Tax=Paxillus rubicundulus Ve08.2h10 TaxID=930991 RepID=A0A0D0DWX0_9AGAM|nr:hypothetical protein PAXRUDRAFT_822197 [Paxillus rubicundulus Ve08.2h10]